MSTRAYAARGNYISLFRYFARTGLTNRRGCVTLYGKNNDTKVRAVTVISFDEKSGIFYLENADVTYAFSLADGILYHLYFGRKVPHDDLRYLNRSAYCAPGEGMGENSRDRELPLYGRGDGREPMIGVTSENGNLLCEPLYKGHRVIPQPAIPGMPSTFGGETLEVTLEDEKKGLRVVLSYTLFTDTSAVTRTCRLENIGDTPLTLTRVYSFAFDLPAVPLDALSLEGAWASERTPERVALHHGVWSIDSKQASSSAILNPFAAFMTKDCTEDAGEVWGVNLVYSSSFRILANVGPHGKARIEGGINDFGFSWHLAPGEVFHAPEAVLAYSDHGLGHLSRVFHDTYREHLIPTRFVKKARPVVINNWEATYFNFNREKLFAIIDAAAGTGIDTFVLDDGWFGDRNDDHRALGDWFVNEEKLEGGLDAIIEHCHEKGLKFGLWFEPEMVNPQSELYKAHPDWAIHAPDYTPITMRNQYALDLTRKEVRDYIVSVVSAILDSHEIDYVKWDYNRCVTEMYSAHLAPDREGEFAHRYALGLYDLCERLVVAHPNILFEGCASGGARFDPAILAYFPQIWTSDDTDAVMRTRIQWGTSLCYPLSSMSCHASVCPNHQTGRTTPWDTRATIAHLGATGYELDVSRLSEEDLAAIPAQVDAYHEMEDLVLEGDLYRLEEPYSGRQFAVELVSKDKSHAHVTFMQLFRVFNCPPRPLKLKGLDPDALYRIEEKGLTLHGRTLMSAGLVISVDRMKDCTCLTYRLTKV